MLKSIGNKAQIFFILLAAVIFNAHMIIPHDHHIAGFDLCSNRQIADSHVHHHPVFPAHCHAFNDLTAEKAAGYFDIDHLPVVCNEYNNTLELRHSVPEPEKKFCTDPEFYSIIWSPGSSLLRAPPSSF
jgi:hypothetical protein